MKNVHVMHTTDLRSGLDESSRIDRERQNCILVGISSIATEKGHVQI